MRNGFVWTRIRTSGECQHWFGTLRGCFVVYWNRWLWWRRVAWVNSVGHFYYFFFLWVLSYRILDINSVSESVKENCNVREREREKKWDIYTRLRRERERERERNVRACRMSKQKWLFSQVSMRCLINYMNKSNACSCFYAFCLCFF